MKNKKIETEFRQFRRELGDISLNRGSNDSRSPSAATLTKIKGFIDAEFRASDGHFSDADIQWIEKHWKNKAIREWKQEKEAGKKYERI